MFNALVSGFVVLVSEFVVLVCVGCCGLLLNTGLRRIESNTANELGLFPSFLGGNRYINYSYSDAPSIGYIRTSALHSAA